MTFSDYFDIEQPNLVKKFSTWHNLSQEGGRSLFEHVQLSMIPLFFCWLEIWTHPFTTLFQTKNSHFPRWVSNTEFLHWFGLFYVKIIKTNHNLMCKLLQGFRIIKNKVKYARWYLRKGAFLKMALMVLKPKNVQWMTFCLFLIIQTLN